MAARNAAGVANADQKDLVVLVTGMSGAGRSTALKAFEDMGYEAVDNLPLTLLASVVQAGPGNRPDRALAIGIDIRTRDFGVDTLVHRLDELRDAGGADVITLFVDCDDEILVRRFTETRRRHPLAGDRPIPDVLKLERRMLEPLRDRADVLIDTSGLAPGALKETLRRQFESREGGGLTVHVISFSYRYGLPREADIVFDARFLTNPHYDPALRDLTGSDPAVMRAIESDQDFAAFLGGIEGMLAILLPRYQQEGKSNLSIAVGCTGGRHRSVYVADRIADMLSSQGWRTGRTHRDIARHGGEDMR